MGRRKQHCPKKSSSDENDAGKNKILFEKRFIIFFHPNLINYLKILTAYITTITVYPSL